MLGQLEHQIRLELITYCLQGNCTTYCAISAYGGTGGCRTHYPLRARQMLCQVSYHPVYTTFLGEVKVVKPLFVDNNSFRLPSLPQHLFLFYGVLFKVELPLSAVNLYVNQLPVWRPWDKLLQETSHYYYW